MEIIPKQIRKLWSDEEIRILVLLSLFFQIILISFSLFRKRSTNKCLNFVLWLSYLGADAIAILALGNLLNQQNDAVEANTSGDIMAFWAPFLLLHLGGPDTITSYSLEDNELWLRHLLNLVVKVVGSSLFRQNTGGWVTPRVNTQADLDDLQTKAGAGTGKRSWLNPYLKYTSKGGSEWYRGDPGGHSDAQVRFR